MAGIAKLTVVCLDCPDPEPLARFYAELTGWSIDTSDVESDSWRQLLSPVGVTLAFQKIPDYVAPTWPGGGHPQQSHLDLDVPDLDVGQEQVLALGATLDPEQPGTTFRVFRDPAGHPFCLCLSA